MPSHPSKSKILRFLYENSLLLVGTSLVLATLVGQFFTGWHDYNSELEEMGLLPLTAGQYFGSGHFLEATFENWESEFLQMGLYVILTIWLRQRGSSESKKLYEQEEVDKEPDPTKEDAPGPVKRGGWQLAWYRRSLSLAFFLLFLGLRGCTPRVEPKSTAWSRYSKGSPPLVCWTTWLPAGFGLSRFRTGRASSYPLYPWWASQFSCASMAPRSRSQ